MPRSLAKAQSPDPQVPWENKIAIREPGAMFFAIDSDGDTVVFSGGLSLCLDQDGDVVGELNDESEIQLLSQLLSRVGRS
jgi:hypothetical protein